MPKSAILAGCVDFVLPPERIAKELSQITLHPYAGLPNLEHAKPLPPAWDEEWMRIFKLLRDASGVDFTFYKKSTISRRIARRMALKKIERLSEYLKYLQGNREELEALYQDLLIHVTSFFREPDVFRALRNKILPQILARKPRRRSHSHLGSGLLDRRGGLFHRHLPAGESGGSSRVHTDSNLRQRYQRAGRR